MNVITEKLELNRTHLYGHLFDVKEPPEKLYLRGKPKAFDLLNQIPERGLAIVGTRYPSPRSKQQTRKWIQELSGSGLIILSGMAQGIDLTAHQAAIDFGLPTIGILGAGLDIPYPKESYPLREVLLDQGGLLVSELDPEEAPRRFQFLHRNRLIAYWSRATVIVEAAQKSGALNTAQWAIDAHRSVYAVPCSPGDLRMAGNQKLLDQDSIPAFWGPHSLGSCWLELATLKPQSERESLKISKDAQRLVGSIRASTFNSHGITTEGLLTQMQLSGWPTERIFNALHQLLQTNHIHRINGFWVAL